MSPTARQLFTVFGARLDADADAGKPSRRQPFMQLLRQRLGDEGGGVDAVDRWVERHLDVEIGRRDASRRWSYLDTAGEIVHVGAVRPESGKHIGPRQAGEITERMDAESDQQISEFRPVENPDRQRREKGRRLIGRHDGRRIGSLGSSEDAISNTELDVVSGRIADSSRNGGEQRQFALVITGCTPSSHDQ